MAFVLNNDQVRDFELRHDFPHLGKRTMMLNARRIEPQPGRQLILLSSRTSPQRDGR